jgi:hypothetical protein
VDGAEQVFDYVFKLALGFDDGAHALQLVGLLDALDEGDGVALGYVVEVQALGGLGLDADLVDADPSRSATRARISPAMGEILGAARISVVSMLTMR